MINGFMHVYAVNNWEEIVTRQLKRIRGSPLGAWVEKIFIGINGPQEALRLRILRHPKIEILYCIDKPDIYEALTLSFLRNSCIEGMSDQVFYMHTKGVSRTHPHESVCQGEWRELMEYYIVDRWKDCLKELREYDVAGVNWHLGQGYMGASSKTAEGTIVTPHFSGNFWWANSTYVLSLPSLYPLTSKYECEFWIGKGEPEVAELWKSGVYHHRSLYPKINYRGKKHVRYYSGKHPVRD